MKAGNEEKEQGTKITRKDSFVPHTHTHTHTHQNYANCLTPTPYHTHAPGTHTHTHTDTPSYVGINVLCIPTTHVSVGPSPQKIIYAHTHYVYTT